MPREIVLAGLVAFIASLVLTPLARWAGPRFGMLDHPNHRSSHASPTPRTGGLAIFASVTLGAVLVGMMDQQLILLACTLLAVLLISGIDDRYNVPQIFRLLVQAGAAAAAVTVLAVFGQLPYVHSGTGWALFTLIWIVSTFFMAGFTNAFNFMDGINGIAGFEAAVCGAVFSLLFIRNGDIPGAVVSLLICAAAAGFLFWNFPGGSIFMGDVGSTGLGFSIAVLALRLSTLEPFPVAFLPLLPFLLDSGVTLGRRIIAGEPFFSAHRSHFYQRLMLSGTPATGVTAICTALAIFASIISVSFVRMSAATRGAALVILLAAHVAVALYCNIRWHRIGNAQTSG